MPAAVAVPLITGAIGAGATVYGARAASGANRHAATLEATGARDALAFAREQEAARQREFRETQARNLALYREGQARLDPYRRFGARSLEQIAQPIPGVGTLGARMGG